MKPDACFQLGYITAARGLNGEIQGLLDADQPEHYQNLESVYILQKGASMLVPFFIESLKLKGDRMMMKLDDVNSREEAKKLIGCGLYLPLDQLPPLQGQSFYFHELVNWRVRDEKLGDLGIVKSILQQSPQILLEMDYQNCEVLIPFNENIVLGVDRERKQVNVSLPDGLLEVYLEDK